MKRKKKAKPLKPIDIALVENPTYSRAHDGDATNPRFIPAQINFRESAIATLAQKGLLDPAQVQAADKFRALWERMGGRGVKAIDYSKEPVDGGGFSDPIDVAQMEAGRELKRCRVKLGEYGYNLVRLVAGERRSLHEICGSRRERESTADHLRVDLTALAQMWGMETKR